MHSQIPSREPGTEANEWVCVFLSPPKLPHNSSFFVISFLNLISRSKQENKERVLRHSNPPHH